MVKITELPCEVITEILEQGTARSIVAAAHSCRYIRNCFFERPSLAGRVILRQIPERLLPYAVAALYADTLPIPRTEAMVHDLIDKLCPALIPASISLVRFLGLGNLSKLEDRHNIIHAMALDYANEAWDFMQTTNMRVRSPGTLQLSENEYLRFCRAFYRVEIFHSVERPKPVGPFQPHAWNDGKYYLDAIPAYDREQIACVLEYQERLLLNSVQEVLAHDVAMGHIGVNYVRAHDDNVIQNWVSTLHYEKIHDVGVFHALSKRYPSAYLILVTWMPANVTSQLALGLRFLVKITGDLSYDEKKRLLHSNYGPGELIDLWKSTDMARNWLDVDNKLADDPWIRNKNGKLVHVFRRSVDAMDLDRGPREAFLRSILGPTPIDFISCHGLRDRAYVLWDMDRLVQLEAGWTRAAPTGSPDTFQIFVDEPQPSRLSLSLRRAPAEKALEESFQARKEIWDKGGSGYWSSDDLSKVVWGGERWAPYELPEDW